VPKCAVISGITGKPALAYLLLKATSGVLRIRD
jgi:hypothetical protein